MKDLLVAGLCVLAMFALSCGAMHQSRVINIQLYRDANPEATEHLTDAEIMELDDFKNIF